MCERILTVKLVLRDDWIWIVPRHTLDYVLEVTLKVILEHVLVV